MKSKITFKRLVAGILALLMLVGTVPMNSAVVNAASGNVKVSSLGKKGTVNLGSKTKSGNWFQMTVAGKKAFCLSLGKTCHTGNTYASEETHNWNQDTGGEKHGYYAKIIRWYVVAKKRSNKAFVLSQALMWSVAEGRNSETQLKDVIKQVKNNTGYWSDKTVGDIYKAIFEPVGDWTAQATYWKKTGKNASYQTLLTVDADSMPHLYQPKLISDNDYYRQRITVKKKDEDGKGLGGIKFTLDAANIDELYSFAITDRDGTDGGTADTDADTEFSMSGYTLDSGRIAWRMTYYLESGEYAYFSDADLEKMTADEKKAAKKYLTEDLELDEGVDFGKNMTKAEAESLIKADLKEQKDEISNGYTLTENSTGNNKNIVLDPTYAKGVDITLGKADSWYRNSDGSWPDMQVEIHSDYTKAYQVGVTNKFKKATFKINKTDGTSSDGKAHGEASLEGAKFQLYSDAACTTKAVVYDASGNSKTAGVYEIKDGTFSTDYLRSGNKYYLKEIQAPTGYVLSTNVMQIDVDASSATKEYTINLGTKNFPNKPILGKVAIQKYYSDGDTGELSPEANTTFQVYLSKKGSFEKCDQYEKATIKTDANGYGISGNLYYGKYTVHQVDSGDVDAIHVNDFEVEVKEDGKVYTFPLNNLLFKAYLRIVKKDAQTGQTVLKPGTAYKIYKVTDHGEELVVQKGSNGHKTVEVDTFETDESGEIMTLKGLRSATYRLYEVNAASGYRLNTNYIEITINSKADNYTSWTDEEGRTHALVTVDFSNEETYGKLAIYKSGEMLKGWDAEKKEFVFEDRLLKGAKFEIYADGNVETQDNQGTVLFKDKEKVATIISGEKAEFENDCNGICKYDVDEDGIVHLTLPLGKYKVKEVESLYGYVFPEKTEWSVEFNWKNGDDEFVINSTSETDDKGVLNVRNALAKTSVELLKQDADSKEPIKGASFGLYTKNDIYNVDGEKILSANEEIATVITGEDGKAVCDKFLPFMSAGYTIDSENMNSGDYYFKELSVSASYYMDPEEVPIHLEYKDAETKLIEVSCVKENTQTTNEIDKMDVAGSKEVTGCALTVTDDEGNEIVSWISGDNDSVKVNVSEKDGYINFKTSFDEKGNLHIGGLLHDKEYVLTETRPADGYVTADSIHYMIKKAPEIMDAGVASGSAIAFDDSSRVSGSSIVAIKNSEGNFEDKQDDKTVMYDEITKLKLMKLDAKTGQALAGAKFKIMDSKGNVVMTFTTKDEAYEIDGKLVVGETYTFTETSAPSGFKLAKPVKYTVKDTSKVQTVTIKDERIPKIPHKPDVPQTGGTTSTMLMVLGFIGSLAGALWVVKKRKKLGCDCS